MKKPTKTSRTKKPKGPKPVLRGRKQAAANLKAAKKVPKLKAVSTGEKDTFRIEGLAAAKAKAKSKQPVPALKVAEFMARPVGATPGAPGGASMAELVEEFGIEAHPMRAKIHYIKNQIPGWEVENKDGRYYATFTDPK